jgi:GMP synthase-like glutamine amidotransferase
MKAHILQHVPFEDIGSIRGWLEARQAEITYTRFYETDHLPALKGLDLVIVMGGPMSINDEVVFPWLCDEKSFIRAAVQEGIPMIGICLGAQLIAGALGARVYRNAQPEIGWFPITAAPNEGDCFRFPERCLAFHWHGETFELPPEAVLLASSEACKNQAFQIGRHLLGLQFHLETTPDCLQSLVANCRQELIPGPYVQSEQILTQVAADTYADIDILMSDVLSYVISGQKAEGSRQWAVGSGQKKGLSMFLSRGLSSRYMKIG